MMAEYWIKNSSFFIPKWGLKHHKPSASEFNFVNPETKCEKSGKLNVLSKRFIRFFFNYLF